MSADSNNNTSQEEEIEVQAKRAIRNFAFSLNKMGLEDKATDAAFAQLINEHRSIQQNFWRCIFDMAEKYAEEAVTDLRNQASKDACQKVSEVLKGHYIPHI